MYVSLGSDCVIKKRLEEYCIGPNQISHIFDWVLSDLTAVCFMLKNPDTISEDKFDIITRTNEGFYVIKHKECYFVSLHDAPVTLSEYDAKMLVVDKYKRRLKRMTDLIQKCTIEFITINDRFNPIYDGKKSIDTDDICKFFGVINEINPFNEHQITVITDSPENIEIISSRVKVIDSKEFLDLETMTTDWYRFFLNWEEIFTQIKAPISALKYTRDRGVQVEIP